MMFSFVLMILGQSFSLVALSVVLDFSGLFMLFLAGFLCLLLPLCALLGTSGIAVQILPPSLAAMHILYVCRCLLVF